MPDTTNRPPPAGDTVSGWSARKQASFAAIAILLGLAISLVAIELFLRYQHRQIAHSEQMEPGLIRYNADLGWQLSPGWSGAHHHYDYDVRYDIDGNGFRVDPAASMARPRVAVLGDSFTFGLGVANTETFVSRLNTEGNAQLNFLNLGVPGYSTDQELLLFQKAGKTFAPDIVLLVVYLGNDLFDNQRPFPLQAGHGKPYFRLDTDGQLVLENTPVALASQPAAAQNSRLADVVLGDKKPPAPLLTRTLGRLHLARRLSIFQQPGKVEEGLFQARFEGYISLFLALAEALQATSQEIGAELVIALLPGSSFINQPESLSAGYQDYLRRQLITELAGTPDIKIIDLAAIMRTMADSHSQQWYFPHEGHLTPQGHQTVARLLAENL